MSDAASAREVSQECERERLLLQNVLDAKRDFDAAAKARSRFAAKARSRFIGKLLRDDPETVSARHQAFDNERRTLDHYVQALEDYSNFLLGGNRSDRAK